METTVTVWNISEEERLGYVAQVQEETTRVMLPVMTFLIFLSVVGAVGNTLVLLVYYGGFKKGATRVLILFIAAVDLFSCLMVIPGEVYDMFHLWDWTNRGLCQARMFISGTSTVTSAMALLVVAVIRYRKVCHPFGWQVESRHARIAAILCLILGVMATIPLTMVNGRQTKPLPPSFTADVIRQYRAEAGHDAHTRNFLSGNGTDITFDYIAKTSVNTMKLMLNTTITPTEVNGTLALFGYECITDDAFRGTIWPLVASAILVLLFLASATPLCVMYGLIGHKAWTHRKTFQVHHIGSSKGGGTADGGGVRVFRMLSSKRKKAPTPCGGGEATASSETTSTSKDGSSQTETLMTSSVNTDDLNRSFDSVQSSSTDMDSLEQSPRAKRKGPLQNRTPDGKLDSKNFEEIRLTPMRSPAVGSSSEDISDTNEGQVGRFVKNSKKSSHNSLFKTLIKRSESEGSLTHVTNNHLRQKRLKKKSQREKKDKPEVINRTTIMLFSISAVYIVGYLSHLSTVLFKQVASDATFESLGGVGLSLWNFCLRLYFVNCAANPLVYSLCDINFRRNCIALFKKK